MRSINLYTSVVIMSIAIAICVGALKLSLYGRSGPGPGFMSFGTGSLLFLVSLHLFLRSLLSRGDDTGVGSVFPGKPGVIFLILGSLIFYAAFLERLGFIVDSAIVFTVMFAVSRTMSWYAVAASSLGLAVGSYVLFAMVLGIGLPPGVLAFGR